ncbi:response regulator [Marinobacter salsuginis]|uniref:Response regulator n=1 Tax=Marinobacter salsuginis TaxID=418719 RepID=A0A5M3Q3T9_9GAMM|nr:response regulator [Marinobacter salsuginis]GBO89884.1 response regulator [Marinobacter salsuginis]
MKALILEHDVMMADLLETVVSGLYSGATVFVTGSVESALDYWSKFGVDLMITGWSLPDGLGLGVARAIRQKDKQTPIILISSRSDRDSVRQAAQNGINSYIVKPFDVSLLHDRLRALVKQGGFDLEPLIDLERRLRTSVDTVIQLPCEISTADVIQLMERRQDLSPSQLAKRWNDEMALISRLLDVANRASFKKTGEPVRNLRDAIAIMGVDMALRQAVALSLNISGHLRHPRLVEKAETFIELAEKVAHNAQIVATRVDIDASEIHVAGLLSRIGELAVLKVMQEAIDQNCSISDDQIESGLRAWAPIFGNRLKVQWHLPIQLRELIGAVHVLPKATTSKSLLVMHTAALMAADGSDTEECLRLQRRLGLNECDLEQLKHANAETSGDNSWQSD